MRKSLTLIALLAIGLGANAQILRSDLGDVGDSQVYRKADTTGVTPGPSGNSQNWNFSSLVATAVVGTNRFIIPSSHTQGSNYPTANLCFNPSNTAYAFYVASADSFQMIGEKSPANTAVVYTDGGTWYRFPQVFGVANLDSVLGTYPDGFISSATRRGWVQTIFDGDGQLTTPFQTYANVKRVEYTAYYSDSSWTGALDAEVFLRRYEWFASTQTMPVLIVHTQQVIINGGNPQNSKEIWWADPNAVGLDAPHVGFVGLSPNPIHGGSSVLSYQLESEGQVRVEVLNMLGSAVSVPFQGQQQSGVHEVEVGHGLSQGLYLVRLHTDQGVHTQKLLIR